MKERDGGWSRGKKCVNAYLPDGTYGDGRNGCKFAAALNDHVGPELISFFASARWRVGASNVTQTLDLRSTWNVA